MSCLSHVVIAVLLMTAMMVIALPVSAESDITGPAVITDGDTLKINDQRIRLHGIDAPESAQTCQVDGEPWDCGQAATEALESLTEGKEVRCEERDIDRYDRIVAVCYSGGMDLNEQMVRMGLALAYRRYSLDYVEAEKAAHIRSVGIWQGEFMPPWEWRQHN
jgi:endonuclease YncB( thermonuclease family)